MGKSSKFTMAALRTAVVLLNAPRYIIGGSIFVANAAIREVINGGSPLISFTVDWMKELGEDIRGTVCDLSKGDFETAAINIPFLIQYGMCVPGLIAGDTALAIRTVVNAIKDGCYDDELVDEEFAKLNQLLANLDEQDIAELAALAANSK